MILQPRPITIGLALAACLYFGFLLKIQSSHEGHLSEFTDSIHHYVSNVLPWAAGKYDGSSMPESYDLVDLEQAEEAEEAEKAKATATTSAPEPTSTLKGGAKELSIPAELELPHLQALCKNTEWTPNLWLHCHSACGTSKKDFCGGLNNARNRLQTCVRWAIDAGAGLILPSLVMRGQNPIEVNAGDEKCLDTWWDLEHLQKSMATNCPQLQLRAACSTNHKVAIPAPEEPSIPALKPKFRGYQEGRLSAGMFRDQVVVPTLKEADYANATGSDNTTVIEWGDSFLGWDYRASDELNTIRKELHLAIPFQNHLLAMGDEIRRSEPLHGGDYIGVHLRGESDWPLQWGDAEQQKANYKAQMRRIREGGSDVSAVFVSSGDHDAIDRFRAELEPLGYAVHDKWSIMEALGEKGGLGEIEAVDFDSKGIVDYAVLVGAKYFMGIYMSTMTQYIAYTRTTDIPNFFDDFIFANSTRDGGNNRIFEDGLAMHGNEYTSILMTNGLDIMDSFP